MSVALDARPGAPEHLEKLRAAPGRRRGAERGVVGQRHVRFCAIRQSCGRRQHADHDVRAAADRDRAAEHVPIAAKHALPETVAQHQHAAAPGLVLVGQEAAAQRDRHAEQVEQPAADGGALNLARFAGADHGEQARGVGFHLLEHPGVFPHAHEVGGRDPVVPGAVRIQHPDLVQAAGIPERQRLQQHAVHHAEDRAVGADAERERNQRDGGKRRRSPQRPQRVADVLPQLGDEFRPAHALPPSLVDGDARVPRAFVIAEALQRQMLARAQASRRSRRARGSACRGESPARHRHPPWARARRIAGSASTAAWSAPAYFKAGASSAAKTAVA